MPVGYKIDPSQARTDLYGINKGLAQVITPAVEWNAEMNLKREQMAQEDENRKAAQREKEENARQVKLEGMLANVKNAINPRDRNLAIEKIKDLNEYTVENIDALKKGDIAAWSGFNQLKADTNNWMDNSNEGLKEHLSTLSKVEAAEARGERFYPETKEGVSKWNDDSNAGVFKAAEMPIPMPKVPLDEQILNDKKKLINTIGNDGKPLITKITPEKAVEMAASYGDESSPYFYQFHSQVAPSTPRYMSPEQKEKLRVPTAFDAKGQPTQFKTPTHDEELLMNQPDKYIPDTPKNMAAAQNWEKIVYSNTKLAPASMMAASQKLKNVLLTSTDNEDGTQQINIEMADSGAETPKEIKTIDGTKVTRTLDNVIRDPKTGEILKATVTQSVTPEHQKKIDNYRKIVDINTEKLDNFNSAVDAAKAENSNFNASNFNELRNTKAGGKFIYHLEKLPPKPVVVPEKVELGPDEAKEFLHNKYAGVTEDAIHKVVSGEQGVKNIVYAPANKKESAESWNKKWSSLKKGESLVGLDGVTYTKK